MSARREARITVTLYRRPMDRLWRPVVCYRCASTGILRPAADHGGATVSPGRRSEKERSECAREKRGSDKTARYVQRNQWLRILLSGHTGATSLLIYILGAVTKRLESTIIKMTLTLSAARKQETPSERRARRKELPRAVRIPHLPR